MNSKLLIALAVAGLLGFTHYKAFKGGKAAVAAEWSASRLAEAEAARQREKSLSIKVQRIDREHQSKKASNLAAANLAASRLRDLEASAAREPDDTATPSGTHGDPRLDIIAQCAGTVVILDEAVKRVASQAEALQQYARQVCIAK